MAFVGIAVTLLGFAMSVASVGLMSSTGGRLGIVVLGIAVSLFGIMGILNPTYQKDAVWRKK